MVGRLLGKGDLTEVKHLVKLACQFILGFQLLIAVVTWLAAATLANLMTSDQQVTDILHTHLTLVPFSLGALGVCMLMVSITNALGRSYTALTISALRLFAFFLPCLWLGAQIADLFGLFAGALIGNLLAGVVAYGMYRRTLAKLMANQLR